MISDEVIELGCESSEIAQLQVLDVNIAPL